MLFPVRVADKWGYIDQTGELRIEPSFDEAGRFKEARANVARKGRYGFINEAGTICVDLRYELTHAVFAEGRVGVKNGGLWGFVTVGGSTAIKPSFADAFMYREELAAVQVHDQWGFVNLAGEMQIRCAFAEVVFFSCGLARVSTNGPAFFINRSGEALWAGRFADVGHFKSGCAPVQGADGKWGVIDLEGKIIIPSEYDGFSVPSQGLLVCYRAGRATYVRVDGSPAFHGAWFDRAEDFCCGCAPVMQGGRWYILRSSGGRFGPVDCDSLSSFQEGRALLFKNGRVGFVDQDGQVVVPPEFDDADDFVNGLASVEKYGQRYYVDTSGKVIWPRCM